MDYDDVSAAVCRRGLSPKSAWSSRSPRPASPYSHQGCIHVLSVVTPPQDQQAMLEAIGVESIERAVRHDSRADYGWHVSLRSAAGDGRAGAVAAHGSTGSAESPSPASGVCFLGRRQLRPLRPRRCRCHHLPGRVLHLVHAVPAGSQPGQPAGDVRVPDADLPADRPGSLQRQSLRRRQCDGGSRLDESECDGPGEGRSSFRQRLHPEYRQILRHVPGEPANADRSHAALPDRHDRHSDRSEAAVDEETACVLVQHPNFFGCLEDVEQLAAVAHDRGALLVVVVDPISLGLLKNPGDWAPTSPWPKGNRWERLTLYGGPYLGIMACREQFVRRLPGRIAGQTVDRRGRRCWVLTLQTREQHIRRDKATSNICTNQGLLALRACRLLGQPRPRRACVRSPSSACRNPLCRRTTGPAMTDLRSPFRRAVLQRVRVPRSKRRHVSHTGRRSRNAGFLAGLPLGTLVSRIWPTVFWSP